MKKFWFMLTALVATCFLVACRGSQGVSTKTIKENKKIVVATESELHHLNSNRWSMARIP